MNQPTFENSYATLPETFFTTLAPTPVPKPGFVRLNERLAKFLNLDADWLESDTGLSALAGNSVIEGTQPLAAKYGGHQFGNWNPRLGDGRALLLGEVIAEDGERYDVQLKGSGPTPYSRGGDGRSPLGPVLREYIVSEAMHALGIPTTRSLAAVTTGDKVFRNVALPGAVLTRVAKSHIRVGTFEYFAAHESEDDLEALLHYTIKRHDPDLTDADNPGLEFLKRVVQRQAELIAKWQAVGFVHGVMNTDNMLVSGETIDYGPCAFVDGFSINAVFSSIDSYGRYAYANQPVIAQWNLAQLARALILPIAEHVDAPTNKERRERAIDDALGVVEEFPATFEAELWRNLYRKIGLMETESDDQQLTSDLFELMDNTHVDFTLCFRALSERVDPQIENFEELFQFPESFTPWFERYDERLGREPNANRFSEMRAVNPIVIPRNHRIEEAIQAAERDDNFEPFHALVDALEDPFEYRADLREYVKAPSNDELVTETFCGT